MLKKKRKRKFGLLFFLVCSQSSCLKKFFDKMRSISSFLGFDEKIVTGGD